MNPSLRDTAEARRALILTLALAAVPAVGLVSAGCARRAAASGDAYLQLPARQVAEAIVWRPDGRALAAEITPVDGARQPHRLVLWDLGEKRAVPWITSGPMDVDPGWLADGSAVVLTRAIPHGYGLFALDPAGKTYAPVPNPRGLGLTCVGAPTGFQPDPNTALIFGRKRNERLAIYAWDRRKNAVRPFLSRPNQDVFIPMTPPGGAWLAFTQGKSKHSARELAVTSIDGKRALFTSSPAAGSVYDYALAEHAAGLVYISQTAKGGELHRVSLPDGKDVLLAKAPEFRSTLSVNSKTGEVAAVVRDGDGFSRIRVFDRSGRVLRATAPGYSGNAPSWSPDGNRFAYVASPTKEPSFAMRAVDSAHLVGPEWQGN